MPDRRIYNYINFRRFGRLVALFPSKVEKRRTKWLCKCDCGSFMESVSSRLVMGIVRSCGCLKVDSRRTLSQVKEAKCEHCSGPMRKSSRNRFCGACRKLTTAVHRFRRFGICDDVISVADKIVNPVGKCEVCGVVSKLAIDHNHDSGKIRGFLCVGCNMSEGYFKGKPDALLRLYAYVLTDGQSGKFIDVTEVGSS